MLAWLILVQTHALMLGLGFAFAEDKQTIVGLGLTYVSSMLCRAGLSFSFSCTCWWKMWFFLVQKSFSQKCSLCSFFHFLLPMENGQGRRKKWDRWFLISFDIGFSFHYKKKDGEKCRDGKERKPFLLLFSSKFNAGKTAICFSAHFPLHPYFFFFFVFLSSSLPPPRLLLSWEHK